MAFGPLSISAQTKDKSTKDKTPTVEVNEGKDGKFRFVVRNADGKLLAMSGPSGYATEKDAVRR